MDNAGSLSNNEINRYSRQMILPDFGLIGQLKLKNTSVLIVGAGGLGCPCAVYLAGAGLGHIGLVDYDLVELSNLHRQILHKESAINSKKVESAASSLQDNNSAIKVSTYHTEINSSNALRIIEPFDIIVDASDNVATRYLLNDAAYFCKKPLVSGSALQWEGQLTVYMHSEGPCYRCLFPIPPPPETVTSCGEGGVLGIIPGTIGVLQALQVINLILNKTTLVGYLLLFDGSDCSFRRIKLRTRRLDCQLCGSNPRVTRLLDYEAFCCSKANDKNPDLKLLDVNQRISVEEYSKTKEQNHLLIDVRSAQEFGICKLSGSVNVPIRSFESEKGVENVRNHLKEFDQPVPVFVVCRRGNDSQKAVLALKDKLDKYTVKDIVGGLHAWARDVDPEFPVY